MAWHLRWALPASSEIVLKLYNIQFNCFHVLYSSLTLCKHTIYEITTIRFYKSIAKQDITELLTCGCGRGGYIKTNETNANLFSAHWVSQPVLATSLPDQLRKLTNTFCFRICFVTSNDMTLWVGRITYHSIFLVLATFQSIKTRTQVTWQTLITCFQSQSCHKHKNTLPSYTV